MLTERGHRSFILAIVGLVASVFWGSYTSAVAQRARAVDGPGGSGEVRGRTAAFVATLEAGGFEVREGHLETVSSIEVLNDWQFMDSCAGNNAGQPYKRFVVPPHRGQDVEADLMLRLRPDEAVVYVGRTPPQCDYFSFVPYLWSRQYPDSCKLTGDHLFASVGDPLNNALIKTEGLGNPFHKNTIVVVTADEGVYERIRDAAGSAGFPASMVNPLVLPADVLHLGLRPGSDRLLVIVRSANFVSEAEGENYLSDVEWARVYRVSPTVAPEPRPFAQPSWRDRAWIHEETLVPGLHAGLERLQAAILARTPHLQSRPLESVRWFYDSKDVLAEDPSLPAYRKYVAGESSDTPYLRSAENGLPTNFLLGDDDMVVVFGVNHAATGIATYSSFGVYGDWTLSHCPRRAGEPVFLYGAGDPIWNGVVGMTSHAFAGSAEQYIPGDPMAPYFYAVRVVRSSRAVGRDRYRVVVPALGDSLLGPPFYADVIDVNKPATIGYRAYLNRATASGPAYEDIIFDRALWFRMK